MGTITVRLFSAEVTEPSSLARLHARGIPGRGISDLLLPLTFEEFSSSGFDSHDKYPLLFIHFGCAPASLALTACGMVATIREEPLPFFGCICWILLRNEKDMDVSMCISIDLNSFQPASCCCVSPARMPLATLTCSLIGLDAIVEAKWSSEDR